jgi:hypothetical protein
MALLDDLAAIENDGGLTPEQKRAARYALKSGAYVDALAPLIGQTFTKGVYTLRINKVWPHDGWLIIDLSAWLGGVPQAVNNPIMVREPPIGDGTTATLRALAQDILASVFGR